MKRVFPVHTCFTKKENTRERIKRDLTSQKTDEGTVKADLNILCAFKHVYPKNLRSYVIFKMRV